MITKGMYLIAIAGMFAFGAQSLNAQEQPQEQSKEEWRKAMDEALQRKQELQSAIAGLEQEISEMMYRDSILTAQVQKGNAEVVALLNQSEARRKEYEELLKRVDNALSGLSTLSKRQMAGRMSSLDSIEAMIELERADRLAQLEEYRNRLAAQEVQLNNLRALVADLKKGHSGDVVVVGTWERDRACLWNIAREASVYGDPFLWAKIWQANKDQIDNPDMLRPGQELRVPAKAPLTKNELSALRQYHNERSGEPERSFTQRQQ